MSGRFGGSSSPRPQRPDYLGDAVEQAFQGAIDYRNNHPKQTAPAAAPVSQNQALEQEPAASSPGYDDPEAPWAKRRNY